MKQKKKSTKISKHTFQSFVYLLTIVTLISLIVTLVVMLVKDFEIEKLEASLGNPYTHFEFKERIPVKEQMKRYIESLPMPEKEFFNQTEEEVIEVQDNEIIEENVEKAQKPEVTEESVNLIEKVQGIEPKIKTFNTSAYCLCEECCDKTDAITASGKKATAWHTIAAGKNYSIGTIIYIPELSNMPNGGWFVVEDRGGAISDDKLDVYQNTHSEALKYGRKNLECYVYEF